MMPDSANPVQQSLTVIEIRPFKGGSVTRVRVSNRTGLARARELAIGYAKARAKFGRGQIRVLRPDRSVERAIDFNQRQTHR
jgi:hypothetical protein